MNVRTVGPSESRRRGGSRPGLAKLCPTNLGNVTSLIPVVYLDAAGDRQHDLVYVADGALGYVRAGVAYPTSSELETSAGVDIFNFDGTTIDFSDTVTNGRLDAAVRNGKVYLADSLLRIYNPTTGVVETVVATAGIVPTAETLVALYRDRIFLSGSSHVWFASRLGDPTDWDYGAAMEDPGAALAGQLADAGRIGDVITAMIPIHDKALVIATQNSLWVLRGDPATGRLESVSDDVGIIDRDAWAMGPSNSLVFLSNDGLYVWGAGSSSTPTRFSEERVPEELREVSTTTNTVSMVFDPVERGYHLFVTPSSGSGTHWWVDLENRALWPQKLTTAHQPVDSALLTEAGLGNAVLASKDGYVRYFLDGQADDDGEELGSHILIGPVRISADDVSDALLAEITGVIEDVSNSGTVTWRVVTGRSAAEAAEAAVDDLNLVLAGDTPVSVKASGTWTEGRGRVSRPRARGAWVVIWLSSTESWSYEVVAVVARQLGRHR